MESLLMPAVNLSILIGLLVWKLKLPLRDFVHGRHVYIRDEVVRVGQQLRSAQAKFEEFSAKLKAIDAEVIALRDQARQDAEASRIRILTESKRISSSIVADARASSEAAFSDMKNGLRIELGMRAVAGAEALIRAKLTGDDRARIRKNFSAQVASVALEKSV